MINIKIQVFSKKGVAGMHLEVEPIKDQPKSEVNIAAFIVRLLQAGFEAQSKKTGTDARFIETNGASAVNEALIKEFGLEDGKK